MAESPCKTCTRVKQPQLCDKKWCNDWGSWFVRTWDAMRKANQVPEQKDASKEETR